MIKPFFESLPDKYPQLLFVSVDVDQNRGHPEVDNTQAVPTFKFFRNNQVLKQFSGANQAQLTSTIEQFLN